MTAEAGTPTERVCELCGAPYALDEGRYCADCDAPTCEHCAGHGREAQCPACEGVLLPSHIEPMLARLSTLPRGDGWAFEYKWDGVRCLAYWDCCELRLESRRLNDITARYPELADLGEAVPTPVILDGEIVALDESGRPSFGRLQSRMHLSPHKARRAVARLPVFYFVFDLLHRGEESLLERPYRERRAALEALPFADPRVHVPPSQTDGAAMLVAARDHGLEGVVAKRLDGRYEPGRRSASWRKVKLVEAQEFVVGGWTPQKGSDRRVGSLLLGVYDESCRLQFVGRVGSGFSDDDHRRLQELLRPLETGVDPFSVAGGTTGADRAPDVHFVVPELVAEVEYRRWPEGGHLQHTAFKGLRTDVPPGDVMREHPEDG